jgi:integrase
VICSNFYHTIEHSCPLPQWYIGIGNVRGTLLILAVDSHKRSFKSRIRSEKLDERDKIGDRWQGGQYSFVFCHPDGKAFHQERPYLWFRSFLKKNKLRYVSFHTLRHTSATLLINQGVHAKIISKRLGHGSIQVTMNTYGFAMRAADQSAADKFESILVGKEEDE